MPCSLSEQWKQCWLWRAHRQVLLTCLQVPSMHSAAYTQLPTITAGYGVQSPVTTVDVWVTCVSLLVGTTIWLILGSIITTLLIHLNAAHSEYTARMTELNQYMKHRELPQVSGATHILMWQLLQVCWASVKTCLTHQCTLQPPRMSLRVPFISLAASWFDCLQLSGCPL